MWTYNIDTKKWSKNSDILDINDYNNLKQDLFKTALYSKDLSGAVYLYTNNTDNIYESLKYKDNVSWYVDPASSVYNSLTSLPFNGSPINKNTFNTYQNYIHEYGFTLKNSFTPTEGIEELNFLKTKVATTEQININSSTISTIDGVKLNEGDLILVKNQISYVDLAYYVDPNAYFESNYYLIDTNSTDSNYYYYNSENGIYRYVNNKLVKQIISTYSLSSNLSIYVTLGDTYFDNQFKLSRKLNGYFPVEGEPFEFLSSHNYLLRHQVDYHDLFENNYYDIIKHGTQSLNIDGVNYTIPNRTIYVGEFGSILNLQDSSDSQFVFNIYKDTLKSITETNEYYWLCGENGSLLKMSKLDFKITKFTLNEFSNFNSISFYNELNGIVVGDYNTIYTTKNGGKIWEKLKLDLLNFSYNSVVYYNYNIIYLAGNNGKFVELNYSDSTGWSYNIINVVKNLTLTDDYELIEDINQIYYTHFNTWGLTYSEVVNQSAGYGITYSMDCLFMVTNNGNLIVYEINNFVTEHKFLYLDFNQNLGDLTSITREKNTDNVILSGDKTIKFDINIFKILSTTSNVISTTGSYTTIINKYSNKIYDYAGIELLGVGNNTLVYNYNYNTTNLVNIKNQTIIPRMLFMDYDMANKLNFFDSNHNYRLTNSITFSSISNTLLITNNQYTWLDYMKDSYKTYPVNSDTINVSFSTPNLSFIQGTSSLTFSNTDITIELSHIEGIYPNVASYTASRWEKFTTSTVSVSSYKILLYKYICIFRLPTYFCSVNDMLEISTPEITAQVMINSICNISLNENYYYAFNDFNQAILSSVKNATIVTITNLNRFKDSSVLLSNFEKHPVSNGYKLSYNNIYTLEPLFNNYTAYKSLEASVKIDATLYAMTYSNTYYQFGYTPNYNLLNYLSSINSIFTASKKFYSMPEYSNLPGNSGGSFTDNNIYYDSNLNSTYLKNKLVFGNNLKFEYDSLWVNTFVDLILHTSGVVLNKTQVLIVDKYYDTEIGGWALIFNDNIIKINGTISTSGCIDYIDIISRNTLDKISEDLELFNNINKTITNKYYNRGTPNYTSAGYWYFNSYDNPIKTKLNTDSYTKILLSDEDIKRYITSVIYTDFDNDLKLNIINVNKTETVKINDTFNYSSKLFINTSGILDMPNTSMSYINFNGGTNSSQQLNTSYIGIHMINKLNNINALVNTPYLNATSVPDTGIIKYNIFDPFLNYKPIDLFDIGEDSMYKIPILINENNLYSEGRTNSIVNYSLNPNIFRLVDGLDINTIANKYHWILEAEISDAIIGQDSNGIVWYSGIWHSGRWFGGTWYSGIWVSGDWYSGSWYSYNITDKINYIEVGTKSVSNLKSIWYNGRWFDGYWDSGIWYNGRRYNGIWNSGIWYNGIWNLGTWNSGLFAGGIWVQGTWYSGVFNCSNKPAYWLNGSMYNGDFQNGIWYNGSFGLDTSVVNKFGSSASNSRNAIWQGGVWNSGNFYSNENINSYGTVSTSLVHKYSTWKTGIFNQGNFYGGMVYNIEFNSGQWYGGIVQDIEIIGVSNPTYSNQITLNGIFRFNIFYHCSNNFFRTF